MAMHSPVPGYQKGGSPLVPKQVKIPPPPTVSEAEDKAAYDEQQVYRMEVLMQKGIRDRRRLADLLQIHPSRVERYMKRVYARWELAGSTKDLTRHRGEALARLDAIEERLWAVLDFEDDAIPQVAVRNLLELQRQRNDLLGLTPEAIARINATTNQSEDILSIRMGTHDKLALIAKRLMEVIEERTAKAGGGPALALKGTGHASGQKEYDVSP